MAPRLLRCLAALAAAALLAAPAAQASIAFAGFEPTQVTALNASLASSDFPLNAVVDAVVVPGDLPPGVVGQAESGSHRVTLDPMVWRMSSAERTFVLLHELAHQVDFQVLRNPERQRFYAAAGFGSPGDVDAFWDPDWNRGALVDVDQHASAPAEQWASAFPLVVWPGNPFVAADGTCVGWGRTHEGCRAPLSETRAVVDTLRTQLGLGPAPAVSAPEPPPPPSAAQAPAPVRAVASVRHGVVHARFAAADAAVAGERVVVEVRTRHGWRRAARLRTDRAGEVAFRVRHGHRKLVLRISFAGSDAFAPASVRASV